MRYDGLINKYREYLPVSDKTPVVTLSEGNTPLIKADNLVKFLGLDGCEIYLKYEGSNPTGSFKDRGMTMAVSKAKEEGSKAIICASTGNTSAAAAAYGARAGLKCYVLIPDGYIALGKLSQAMMYGAEVIAINGNFDEALEAVKDISSHYPITLVNSLNPYRIEGQKTGAFEIIEALEDAPDYHFIPVGNAGNITAYWKGYREFFDLKKCSKLPKMMGIQAEGAAAIEAQVEQALPAGHSGGEVGAHHRLVLEAGLTGQEEAVVQHHRAAPVGGVHEDQIFIGGLQHQQAVAGVLRLDGRLAGDLAPDGLGEEVAHPLDAGGGVHIAQHPLHGAGLDGDLGLAEVTHQLALSHVHLGAVIGVDGGGGGDAQVALVLDDREGPQLGEGLDVVIVHEIGNLIHKAASKKILWKPLS